jgi:cytochrome c553
MAACGNCHGQHCTNIKVTQPELQSIDSEDESRNAFDIFS